MNRHRGLRSRLSLLVLGALLGAGCSTTVTQSFDPQVNYALKFSEMPTPAANVVHSRVEREAPVFCGFDLPPRNREWQFELVATTAWVAALRTDFTPIDWADVKLRPDVPAWFAPDPQTFSAFSLNGTSGITAAHLFIETAPKDRDQVRLFLCRH